MIYTEFILYGAIFYGVLLLLIVINSMIHILNIEKYNSRKNHLAVLWIGSPRTQLLMIFMIITSLITIHNYYQVKSFKDVIASEHTASIFSLKVSKGQHEAYWIKDPVVIHDIVTTLEETMYMPSFKESTTITKSPTLGGAITVEFLAMEMLDSITISNKGIIYNNRTGQAYGVSSLNLFECIHSSVDFGIQSEIEKKNRLF
ncbi:hypothetical protein [Petrocella sp. FN5]|uniref:hypothetical protein n=1 Tax=Petrocella sp. FN5 TaxID=3032002 RepID=UPI0023DA9C0E|nr:hypothetical protein [Petrocella sp. FN5]MDF1616682.1 hypothetical protein [Petrocella sp. FN5]